MGLTFLKNIILWLSPILFWGLLKNILKLNPKTYRKNVVLKNEDVMSTLTTRSTRILALMVALLSVTGIRAQEAESPYKLGFGVGLESRYVWRGYNYNGAAPSLQPYMSFGVAGFEIGAWGAYQLGGNSGILAETDVYLSYTVADWVKLTLTDFFYQAETGVGQTNRYFDYEEGHGHFVEASVTIANESSPISFLAAVNLYGDMQWEDPTKEAYSSYFELTYAKSVAGVDFKGFAGFAVGEKGVWYTGYDPTRGTNGFVNIGVAASKEIKITDSFSLPVYGRVITNPAQENYYIVFGLSL